MTNKIYSACMIIVMLAIIAGGCSENDINDPQEPAKVQKYHMVVNAAKVQNNQAKTPRRVLGLDGNTLNASWAIGEEVTVYNVTKNTAISGVLTAQSNGASTTLSGDLTGSIEPSDILTLKFLSPNYTGQDGTLEYISAHCDYAEACVTVASVSGGNITTTANAVFENKQAIVKFTLISKADGLTLLNPTTLSINDGTNDIITLSDIPAATYTENGDGILLVAMPGFADKNIKLSATVGTKLYIYEKDDVTFANGNYYSITTKLTPEGALPFGFSVSPTKKVRFSKGNLQYNAALGTHQCADGTTQQGTWRFAEKQCDYVGDATEGTVYENDVKCDNAFISSTYNGWIDLFGWGTSGWNSGAKAYQPWATSVDDKDYYPGNSSTNDLQGNYANADWGVYNAIQNGGDEAGLWRTLTGEEWNYLLCARTNANQLCGQATIDGLHVLILLPDNWTMPNSLTFIAPPSNWTDNQYTSEEWKVLEQSGAVCIPSAKRRIYGNTIDGGGNIGIWTSSYSTIDPIKSARQIVIYGTSIESNENSIGGRHNGHSVRLVQDVE